MPLKAVVENLEDVAEPLREHYTKGDDGKYRLAAEGVEDVSGLKSALAKEREGRSSAEKALKTYEGVDVKKYQEWLQQQEGDEEAKLFSSGKKDELRARWTTKMQEAHQKQLDKLTAEHKTALDAANERTAKYEQRVLENHLRQAAIEVGIHPQAVRDALFQGRATFVLDDNGNAVQKREDGTIVIGKDGKTPFSPKEWLESMRSEAPHWFPANGSGTGAFNTKTTTNGSGQKTMTRSEFARLSPMEQHKFIRKDGGALVDG
jgi:hypothetical protein